MLYTFALKVWNISKWICLVFLIPTAVDLLKSVVAAKKPEDIFPNSFLFGSNYRTLTLSILSVLVAIALLARIIVLIGNHLHGSKPLQKYLRLVFEANQSLNPKGFAQQSQALISVNVPLDNIFINLHSVPDRPVYDVPSEQQKLLEELRRHSDLTPEELEERIQKLRVVWHSQLGQELSETRQMQNVSIKQVLQQLKANNQVAIILGAPGSGKTTAIRWLAFQMAQASFSPKYRLPKELSPRQIPVMLRISDYAKLLSIDDLSFEQFFKDQLAKVHPDLPSRGLEELEKGHCLLLLDGLDEVASDNLRRRIAEIISTFISKYSVEKPESKYYNRFIVTSRIVGYEPGSFAEHAHYTLLDLEDEQIEQFLTNWCPAVEIYQTMAAQGMKKLTSQQVTQANKSGAEQRDRLLDTLRNSPSIKRLAVNPLMLTILALIQRSGRTLPHRRIELYQIVTRTLLDNWNQETGRKFFSVDEIPLADQLLVDLAYRLHSSDPVLVEQDVQEILHRAMTEFYGHSPKESDIEQFIETLRSSSGLFVESGQGLFSFMHRTFQEYFVALYLLRKPLVDLKQFVVEHYTLPIWREPLLLAISQKSGQSSRNERQEASVLIQAIADTSDTYDLILHRNLLFAANSIVDCSAWLIDRALQHHIANCLFDLYGDSLGSGRYTQLQQDIETVALLWLRGQPQRSSQQSTWPPLLEAWRTAMCDANQPLRQKGAVRLLATIAADLHSCPPPVLIALIPPLLQLVCLQDLPCSAEIKEHFPKPIAYPSSPEVEDNAFIALRLLDEKGPVGWLHTAWLRWDIEQPELLKRLTQHALELGRLMTPVTLPSHNAIGHSVFSKIEDPIWKTLLKIAEKWKRDGQRDSHKLQMQLLHTINMVRYPHSYLLWQLLRSEETELSLAWYEAWDKFLQKEMMLGRSATFHSCLSLRLLLSEKKVEKRQEIANELMEALLTSSGRQLQSLIAITNILYFPRIATFQPSILINIRDPQLQRSLPYPQFVTYGSRFYHTFSDPRWPLEIYDLFRSTIARRILEFYDIIDLMEINDLLKLHFLNQRNGKSSLIKHRIKYFFSYFEFSDIMDGYIYDDLFVGFDRLKIDFRYINNIANLLNKDKIISILCEIISQRFSQNISYVLLALATIISTYDTISSSLIEQITDCLQSFEKLALPIGKKHHFVIEYIIQQTN